MTARKPTVSIVITSLNGAKRIAPTLKSLKAQRYPKGKITIIVIDDGSTDNTAEVAKKHGAQVLSFGKNRGRPAGRNAGLKLAKGDFVVYTDDDCIADKYWIERLLEPFANPKVVAVGGQIIPYKTTLFAERFMDAVGYGNPAPRSFGVSKNPVRRFGAYLKSMFAPIATATQAVEAQAVYTANVAYRRSALKAIKGFDENLKTDEDADVSTRLIAKGGTLIFAPDAKVKHKHPEKITQFIRQTFFRAENTYHYYKKEQKTPPLFPFPFLYALITAGLAFVAPIAALIFAAIGPVLVYNWWIVRAVRSRKPEQVIYSYVQLALEAATILGLLRGMSRDIPAELPQPPPHKKSLPAKAVIFGALLAVVAINAAILLRDSLPILSAPFTLAGLLFVPGVLLAIALRLNPKSKADLGAYSFGLGLAFWLLGGLAINWLLPLIGIPEPLRLEPLWMSFNFAIATLIGFVWWRNRDTVWQIAYRRLSGIEWAAITTPLAIIGILSVGALALNNGGIGTLTLIGIGAIAVYIIGLSFARVRDGVRAFGLWGLGAALLLMYALRSTHVLGWDIHSEYHVFELALEHGYWSMSYFAGEAYNACLSITLLPAILHNFLPVTPEYIFKFIMQLLFAALPAVIFLISRRYIFGAAAGLAGFTFLSQSWFYEQMPALVRQEIALLFFGLALLAVFDQSLKRWQQITLFMTSSVALILSHYSTAYIWLAMFGLALGLGVIVRLWRKPLRERPRQLTWPLFIASVIAIFIWEGLITHTGGSFTEFAEKTAKHASEALSPTVIKDGLAQLLFANATPDPQLSIQILQETATKTHTESGESLYSPALYQHYYPHFVDYQVNWPALLPEQLNALVLQVSKISKLLIINVFTLLGVIILFLRARKNSEPPHYMFTVLALAAIPLIVTILFLPIFQINYNITRLFTQAFIVLSLATIVGLLAALFFLPKVRAGAAAILLSVFFLFSVGFTERFVGGPARLTLQQPDGAFDTYYVHDPEVASARWLREQRDPNVALYADMLAALRLRSYAHAKTTSNDIFPSTITPDAYVFMSHANVTRGTVYAQYGNDIVTYEYPTHFLDANKDLLYTSGSSRIYR